MDAAEAITGPGLDTLNQLVAKSLLVCRGHRHGPTRLSMLDTVRAYAAERFVAAAGREAVCERHFLYYLALAERHGSERALWGASGKEEMAQLDADVDNIHGALRWAVGRASAQSALALRSGGTGSWEAATQTRSSGSTGR